MSPGGTKVDVDEPVGEAFGGTKLLVDKPVGGALGGIKAVVNGLVVEALVDARVGWLEQVQLALHAVYADCPLNPRSRCRCDGRKPAHAPFTSHLGMYLETYQVVSDHTLSRLVTSYPTAVLRWITLFEP